MLHFNVKMSQYTYFVSWMKMGTHVFSPTRGKIYFKLKLKAYCDWYLVNSY